VLKLDPNFNLLWARRFGTSGQNNPDDLAFNKKGNGSLYVTGVNGPGEASFGTTGAGTNILDNNTGAAQSYVLLVDTNGNAISPPQDRDQRPRPGDRRWGKSDYESYLPD
jgi:hypothetical protein